MTFVPGSIKYIAPSVKMMVNEGCEIIHCNLPMSLFIRRRMHGKFLMPLKNCPIG